MKVVVLRCAAREDEAMREVFSEVFCLDSFFV